MSQNGSILEEREMLGKIVKDAQEIYVKLQKLPKERAVNRYLEIMIGIQRILGRPQPDEKREKYTVLFFNLAAVFMWFMKKNERYLMRIGFQDHFKRLYGGFSDSLDNSNEVVADVVVPGNVPLNKLRVQPLSATPWEPEKPLSHVKQYDEEEDRSSASPARIGKGTPLNIAAAQKDEYYKKERAMNHLKGLIKTFHRGNKQTKRNIHNIVTRLRLPRIPKKPGNLGPQETPTQREVRKIMRCLKSIRNNRTCRKWN